MEIAISPAIAAASPEPAISEPISPELVLVDPELRRALQAQASERVPRRLVVAPDPPGGAPERAPLSLVESTPPRQPAAVTAPVPFPFSDAEPPRPGQAFARSRRYLARAILPISLVLNAILITLAVSDATVSPPTAAPPAPSATAARLGARDPRIERKLLTLVVEAPAGKLPSELIDAKTGLAKNNLHAVCRRERGRRMFLCLVQPAKHKPVEGLYARYRPNRKGSGGNFSWYSYRKR